MCVSVISVVCCKLLGVISVCCRFVRFWCMMLSGSGCSNVRLRLVIGRLLWLLWVMVVVVWFSCVWLVFGVVCLMCVL